MPPCDGGRTGRTNSRYASEAHHTHSPGWTPVRVFVWAGRPAMRFERQAPLTFRTPLSAGHSTRGQVPHPCPLDAIGLPVNAPLDVTHLPAPTAWAPGRCPPASLPVRGRTSGGWGRQRLPVPPASHRPCWGTVRHEGQRAAVPLPHTMPAAGCGTRPSAMLIPRFA